MRHHRNGEHRPKIKIDGKRGFEPLLPFGISGEAAKYVPILSAEFPLEHKHYWARPSPYNLTSTRIDHWLI
jgi:hypothetical protein